MNADCDFRLNCITSYSTVGQYDWHETFQGLKQQRLVSRCEQRKKTHVVNDLANIHRDFIWNLTVKPQLLYVVKTQMWEIISGM